MAKGHINYCGLVCGLHMEKQYVHIPIHLNYCVIFVVNTQFTNVAMGCVIQTGRPHAACGRRVWGPCCSYFLYVLRLCSELFHILPNQNQWDSSVCVWFQPSDLLFQSFACISVPLLKFWDCVLKWTITASSVAASSPSLGFRNVGHYRQCCKNLKSLGLICPNKFYIMLAFYAALLNKVKRQEQWPCSAFLESGAMLVSKMRSSQCT